MSYSIDNNPDLLNKRRNKSNINKLICLENDIIEYIDNFDNFYSFSLKRCEPYNNEHIKTKLYFNNLDTSFNYTDKYVADLCSFLANDLRDQLEKNIFFDLRDGYFYFFI